MSNHASIEPWNPGSELFLHSHFSEPADGLERDGLAELRGDALEIVKKLMKAGPDFKLSDEQSDAIIEAVRDRRASEKVPRSEE